jgi:hypothetical protein
MSPCLNATVTVPVTAYVPALDTTTTISTNAPKVGDTVTIYGKLWNSGGTAGQSTIYVQWNGVKMNSFYNAVSVAAGSVASPASTSFQISFVVPTATVGTPYQVCVMF